MKTTLVIAVHGFNISDKNESVGKLEKYFLADPGTTVKYFEYSSYPGLLLDLLFTRLFNDELSDDLAKMIRRHHQFYDRVIVVGHSNGCAIAHMASEKLYKPGQVDRFVYINPALRVDLSPSRSVGALDIYHNKQDKIVGLSRFLFWGAKYRPWGKMGAIGYQGEYDKRIMNYNTDVGKHPATGHSGLFDDDVVPHWGRFIVDRCNR